MTFRLAEFLGANKALRLAEFGALGGAAGSLLTEVIRDTSRSSAVVLMVWVGLWFAVIGCCIATAITFAQFRYLRERSSLSEAFRSMALFASTSGFVAGAVAQGSYTTVGPTEPWRVVCWGIAGGLLALALSYRIPNLPRLKAVLGGSIGGAIGGGLFICMSSLASQILGRLFGIASIGFSIGLMLGVVETVFRKAWLELQYGPREIKTVLLGREPVTLGSDATRCTAYAPGAEAVACTFIFREGQVEFKDHKTGNHAVVSPAGKLNVGRLVVIVRQTGSDAERELVPNEKNNSSPLSTVEWWRDFK